MTSPLPATLPFQPTLIFTDVDDTLTLDGQLPLEAFSALHKLRGAGIKVIPVTGGCGGWCDCMVRTWPIDGLIGENGAFIMAMKQGKLTTTYMQEGPTRAANRKRLDELIHIIKKQVPEAKLTGDCQYRLTDIAYDIGQDSTLPDEKIEEILHICRTEGVQARASSIHINIWMGEYSKCSTAQFFLDCVGLSEKYTIFVGDSPNDESMFSGWSTTVGVANIKPYLPRLSAPPTYITQKPGGLGFAELAQVILKS